MVASLLYSVCIRIQFDLFLARASPVGCKDSRRYAPVLAIEACVTESGLGSIDGNPT